jgi:hypothetical protein
MSRKALGSDIPPRKHDGCSRLYTAPAIISQFKKRQRRCGGASNAIPHQQNFGSRAHANLRGGQADMG